MTTEDKRNKTFKTLNRKELNAFQICCSKSRLTWRKQTLDEALETLVKITTSTIGAERVLSF